MAQAALDDDVGAFAHRLERRRDALVVTDALRDIHDCRGSGAQRIHESLLVLETAPDQQLEQRILVFDDGALAEREAHVERRAMPAAEKVREIRRVERELAVADVQG